MQTRDYFLSSFRHPSRNVRRAVAFGGKSWTIMDHMYLELTFRFVSNIRISGNFQNNKITDIKTPLIAHQP